MHPTAYTATISTSVDSALKDENLLTCHAHTNDGGLSRGPLTHVDPPL